MQYRIGNGYDVHRFAVTEEAGAAIMIGGVAIASKRRLLAHSDGDVLVHALCDALLGALALGDIGHHFPDSDPQYRGISSLLLLQRVQKLVHDKGWAVTNIDLTLIAQEPRFAPHVTPIRTSLANVLATDMDRINVKATTTEGLGFAGRKEGIACQAVVLLQRPEPA